MATPLIIWCNAWLPASDTAFLEQEITGHKLVPASDGRTGLEEADVAFGQPDPEAVIASRRLRWVHLTSAGYTRYDRDDLRTALAARGAVVTNSSHVYDDPCAQHVLAMMLAFARQLPQALDSQRTDHGWRNEDRHERTFLLRAGQTVLLLGFGAIGHRLSELLSPFGVRVIAVRRKPAGDEPIEVFSEMDLDSRLPEADHIVNLLPESPSTVGFVGAERLAKMKPGVFFYNVGRGATVDQEALIAALQTGQVRAAYLDVTSPEPLPPEHPLWTAPNCYITPHVAGGFAGEYRRLVEHFLANLRAFERGEPLRDRVF